MKNTLQTFFERTRTSRDASAFFLKYHSIEPGSFLLLIPVFRREEDFENLIDECRYLRDLELAPSLYWNEDFIEPNWRNRARHVFDDEGFDSIDHPGGSLPKALVDLQRKHHFFKIMCSGGPLCNTRGEVVSRARLNNVKDDWDTFSTSTLQWVQPLLKELGPSQALQMVNPGEVLVELFTEEGSGTLISLGYRFNWHSMDALSTTRLRDLIEAGFGRQLKPDYPSHREGKVLLEEQERGAIVISQWENVAYLDKVVVRPEFFGRGIGSLLLDELTSSLIAMQNDKICWRARHDNPYLERYAQLVRQFADRHPLRCGTRCDERFVYHFIGLDAQEREWALGRMSQHPSSFVESSDLHP